MGFNIFYEFASTYDLWHSTQKGRHSPHNEVNYKSIRFGDYREDKEVGESVNEDQGQRGGDGRAEKVNRAEGDSNQFDLLPDELLEMIIEHSLSWLSRGSFVRAFTRLHNVFSRFRRIVMPHQRSLPRLHLDGNICPGYNSVMSLIRKYNKGSSVVMELKDIISSKKWIQGWVGLFFTGLRWWFYIWRIKWKQWHCSPKLVLNG